MTATEFALNLTRTAAEAASAKLGEELVAIDVSDRLFITDTFLIVTGRNERQVGSIVDAVMEALHPLGAKPLRREGEHAARWVLLDFGDIVVHVMHEEDRAFYALERLWRDCPLISLPQVAYAGDRSSD